MDSLASPQGDADRSLRLLLVRHGAAEGAGEGRFFGRTDVDLLRRGEAQARAAAERVAPWLDGEVPAFFTSPLRRARRSAEALAGALGLPPPGEGGEGEEGGVVGALSEVDLGEWEGETYGSLHARAPERLRAHYADVVHSRPPGGESLDDLRRRVLPALDGIRARAPRRTAIVVAHAAVNRVILCHFLGMPMKNFFRIGQDFAALNVIDFYGDVPLVRLVNG